MSVNFLIRTGGGSPSPSPVTVSVGGGGTAAAEAPPATSSLDTSTMLVASAKALQNTVHKRVADMERVSEQMTAQLSAFTTAFANVQTASTAISAKSTALVTLRTALEASDKKINADMDKVLDRLKDRVLDRGLWRARQREKQSDSAPAPTAATAGAGSAAGSASTAAGDLSGSINASGGGGKRLLYDYVDRQAIDRLRLDVRKEIDSCALACSTADDLVRDLNQKVTSAAAQLSTIVASAAMTPATTTAAATATNPSSAATALTLTSDQRTALTAALAAKLTTARRVIEAMERSADEISVLYVRIIALHDAHTKPVVSAAAGSGAAAAAAAAAAKQSAELDRDLVVVATTPLASPVRQRSHPPSQAHAAPQQMISSFLNTPPPSGTAQRKGSHPPAALAGANASAAALAAAISGTNSTSISAASSPLKPSAQHTYLHTGTADLFAPASPRAVSPALSPSPPPFANAGTSGPASPIKFQRLPDAGTGDNSTTNSGIFDNEKTETRPPLSSKGASSNRGLKIKTNSNAGGNAEFDRAVESALSSLQRAYAQLQTHAASVDAAYADHSQLVTALQSLLRDLDVMAATAAAQGVAIDAGLAAAQDRSASHTQPILNELKNLSAWYNQCASGYDAMLGEIIRRHNYTTQYAATLAQMQRDLLEMERNEQQIRARFHHTHGRYLPPALCPSLVSEAVPVHVRFTPETITTTLPRLSAEFMSSPAAATALAAANGLGTSRRRDSVTLSASAYAAAPISTLFGHQSITTAGTGGGALTAGNFATSPPLSSATVPATASASAAASVAIGTPAIATPAAAGSLKRSPPGSSGGSPAFSPVVHPNAAGVMLSQFQLTAPVTAPAAHASTSISVGMPPASPSSAAAGTGSPSATSRTASFSYNPHTSTAGTTIHPIAVHASGAPPHSPNAPVFHSPVLHATIAPANVPAPVYHTVSAPIAIASTGIGAGSTSTRRRSLNAGSLTGGSPPPGIFLAASPLLRPLSLTNPSPILHRSGSASGPLAAGAAPHLSPLSFAVVSPAKAPPALSLLQVATPVGGASTHSSPNSTTSATTPVSTTPVVVRPVPAPVPSGVQFVESHF